MAQQMDIAAQCVEPYFIFFPTTAAFLTMLLTECRTPSSHQQPELYCLQVFQMCGIAVRKNLPCPWRSWRREQGYCRVHGDYERCKPCKLYVGIVSSCSFFSVIHWTLYMEYLLSSTHNTRIERLWVEVGSQFARGWRAFFYRLEWIHGLDAENPYHLWLLHYLFLNDINTDCDTFRNHWNSHPISRHGHNQSPLVRVIPCIYVLSRVFMPLTGHASLGIHRAWNDARL